MATLARRSGLSLGHTYDNIALIIFLASISFSCWKEQTKVSHYKETPQKQNNRTNKKEFYTFGLLLYFI